MAYSDNVFYSTPTDINHHDDDQLTGRPPSSLPLAVRARPEVMRIPKVSDHRVIRENDRSNAEKSKIGFDDSTNMTDTAPTSSNALYRKRTKGLDMSTMFRNMWNYITTLQVRLNLLFESPAALLMFSVFQSVTDYFSSTPTPTTDSSTSTVITTTPDERSESQCDHHTTNTEDDNNSETAMETTIQSTIQENQVETTSLVDTDIEAVNNIQATNEPGTHDNNGTTTIYDATEDMNHDGIPLPPPPDSGYEIHGETDDEPCAPPDLPPESPRQLSINQDSHHDHHHMECTSELSKEDCESVNTMLSFSTMDKSTSFLARRPRSTSMRERLRKVKKNVRKSFHISTCWKPGNSSYN